MNQLKGNAVGLFSCLLMAGAQAAKDVDEHLAKAKYFASQGEHRAAVIEFKNVLRQVPDDAVVRVLLANTYLAQQNGAAAEKELRRAIKLNPNMPATNLKLLKALALQLDDQAVIDLTIEQTSLTASEQAEVALIKGVSYLRQGESLEAEIQFVKAQHAAPQSVFAKLASARLAVLIDDYVKAESIVDETLQASPQNIDALEIKASLREKAQDFSSAEAIYAQLNQRQPQVTRYVLALATNQLKNSKRDLAEQTLKRFGETDHPEVNFLRGQILYQRHNYSDAVNALGKVLAVVPGHPPSMLFAGASHYYLGNTMQASSLLQGYLKNQPDDKDASRLLANLYLSQGKVEEAIATMASISEPVAQDLSLLSLLGVKAIQLGDSGAAEHMIQLANQAGETQNSQQLIQLALLNLSSGDSQLGLSQLEKVAQEEHQAQAQYTLFTAYLNQKQRAKAEALAQRLQAQFPDRDTGYVMSALLANIDQRPAQAKAWLKRALKMQPGSPEASHILATAALKEQDIKTARQLYADVLQHNPGYSAAALALYRLERQHGTPEAAVLWLKQAAEQNTSDIDNQLYYIRGLMTTGNLEQAQSLLDSLPESYHSTATVLMTQVKLAEQKNSLSLAISAQQQLLSIQSSPQNYAELARLQGQNKQFDEALNNIERAINEQGKHQGYRLYKGQLLVERKQYEQAKRWVNRHAHFFSQQPEWIRLSGQIALAQQKLPEALDIYHRLFQAMPEPDNFYQLTRLQLNQGLWQRAEQGLLTWIGEHEEDAYAINMLGSLYMNQNQMKQASSTYQRLINLVPENSIVLNNLAWALLQQGQAEKALPFAEKAVNLSPNNPDLTDTLEQIRSKLH